MACFQGGKYHLQDGAKTSFSGLVSSVTLKGFAGVKYHKGLKKKLSSCCQHHIKCSTKLEFTALEHMAVKIGG